MWITLLRPSFRRFQRKFEVDFIAGHYRIKTIETPKELSKVFSLRYEVFQREYCGKKLPFGWDCDEFDLLADHLVVIDQRTGEFVATYRLISSEFSQSFYSETEFKIGDFLASAHSKLELGRACVRKRYRNGIIMSVLWKGLLQYIEESKSEFLFGCSSIQTTHPESIAPFLAELRQKNQVLTAFPVRPHSDFRCLSEEDLTRELRSPPLIPVEIPSLLRSYLKAGAKVCDQPALDRVFQCIDLFTVMETAEMRAQFRKKFAS